jgi:prophage regulatory protein
VKPIFFLELEDAAAASSISPSTLQRLVRAGEFPAPRQISGRRVGWLTKEIEAWCEARPLSAQLPPENTGNRSKKNTSQAQAAGLHS